MKEGFCVVVGLIGTWIAHFVGGMDALLISLVVLMGIDMVTGVIVAGVFHQSPKTEQGRLESHAFLKGAARKFYMLSLVGLGQVLDYTLGSTIIRNGVVISLMAGEALSILENAPLMGINVPQPIQNALEILNKKEV